jgi:2-hydroxychromene-2-carboxylate isomerase
MTTSSPSSVDWYFDFVSPYSYLCLYRLQELRRPVAYKPVLFAGLLNHWGQKGPAEVAPKRRWTYRSCAWLAREQRVPFRFPAAHPFNPLPYLRLVIAAGTTPEAVLHIFDAIWTSGADASDPERVARLCRELRVAPEKLDEAKEPLRRNTEEAAARGVFGVPTFVVDSQVFWGMDSMPFLKAFLENPGILGNEEMRRLESLPVAAARKP